MDLVTVSTLQRQGLDNMELRVEAVRHPGTQHFSLSGLPDTQLKDARDKIRSLIHRYCPWGLLDRLIVNIEPAEIIKSGSHLELPIFVATACVLVSKQNERQIFLPKVPVAGSVDLEGNIRHTHFTKRLQQEGLIFWGPHNVSHVSELMKILALDNFECPPSPAEDTQSNNACAHAPTRNKIHVLNREEERLAILCASIGKLPILLLGAPGVGKSHLAKWAASICPTPSSKTQYTLEKIWAAFGMSYQAHSVPQFFPHSRTHIADFVGRKQRGQSMPGYFSLAHGGVLVLDEFPELARDAREIFRLVLEQKSVDCFYSGQFVRWPADFWFIATANPCPCGYAKPNNRSQCSCAFGQWKAYQQRLSGPLLDRFAIKLFMDSKAKAPEEHDFKPEILAVLNSSPENLADFIEEKQQKLLANSKSMAPETCKIASRSDLLKNTVFKILKIIGLPEIQAHQLSASWNERIQFQA